MVYSFDYDTNYIPAMPTIEIRIGRALRNPTLELTALVDSGADGTIIPVSHLKRLQARKAGKTWMTGTTGERAQVDLYQVSLQFGPYRQGRLEVVGDTRNDEVILGRDVLNHLIVTLNGLAHVVEVTD